MRLAFAGALLALVFAPGCDRRSGPPNTRSTAAWEEGLTLGYEDPTLPPAQRMEKRQQVRVKQTRASGQALAVTKTFTSLTGQWDLQVVQEDGGVALSRSGAVLLPEGFPDRVEPLGDARARSTGWWAGPTSSCPGCSCPRPPRGWASGWNRSRLESGARTRTLFLPDIGEAETLTWSQGRWVATNLLVTRGFTDVPAAAANSHPGSTP